MKHMKEHSMGMHPDGGPHEPKMMYRHEEEKPSLPVHGHQMSGMGVKDFKGEADQIAYGQAGMAGCKSDSTKIEAQFKHYAWEGTSEY